MSESIALIIFSVGLIAHFAMRWSAPKSSPGARLLVAKGASEVGAGEVETAAETASGGSGDV